MNNWPKATQLISDGVRTHHLTVLPERIWSRCFKRCPFWGLGDLCWGLRSRKLTAGWRWESRRLHPLTSGTGPSCICFTVQLRYKGCLNTVRLSSCFADQSSTPALSTLSISQMETEASLRAHSQTGPVHQGPALQTLGKVLSLSTQTPSASW